MLPYVHSNILPATLNTACRRSKWSAKTKHTVHCQGCYFWGDSQVLGYVILKKMMQEKEILNEKQSLPCRCWCHGQLLFINIFLRFFLLLLLHHSGKIAIPRDHLFLLLQILHLVLFKSLHRQVDMSIYGDRRVVLWWDIDGNLRLSF